MIDVVVIFHTHSHLLNEDKAGSVNDTVDQIFDAAVSKADVENPKSAAIKRSLSKLVSLDSFADKLSEKFDFDLTKKMD